MRNKTGIAHYLRQKSSFVGDHTAEREPEWPWALDCTFGGKLIPLPFILGQSDELKNSIPARLVCVHSVTSLSSWYFWGNFWWLNLRMFFKLQLCEGLHISTFWDEFGVSFHLVKQSAWATLLRSHEHVGWTKGEVTAVVQMHNLDRIEGMIGEGNFHKFNLLRIHIFPHRI